MFIRIMSDILPCCSARLSYVILRFKETPLSGLLFSYLSLLAGIRLALHPLPPDAEGFLRHNPRLQYWEVAGHHSTTPCESGVMLCFYCIFRLISDCLFYIKCPHTYEHTCFFAGSFSIF